MSFFVYVSHRRPVEAFEAAEQLIVGGHYPFVPQLNKLVTGRPDEQWEDYFKMWLFLCDCMLKTPSFRPHEEDWARSNDIPVVDNIKQLADLKVPLFKELGAEFGALLAAQLPDSEDWRRESLKDVQKSFTDVAGLGADPIAVGALALKLWDRRKRSSGL